MSLFSLSGAAGQIALNWEGEQVRVSMLMISSIRDHGSLLENNRDRMQSSISVPVR